MISVARAVTLIVFPTNGSASDNNYFKGAIMYFILGAIGLIISISMMAICVRTEYYIYFRQRNTIIEYIKHEYDDLNSSELTRSPPNNAEGILDENGEIRKSPISPNVTDGKRPSLLKIHNKVLYTGYGLAIIYIQTFLVFPGVLLQGGISFIDNISWNVWFIITLFNLMDTVSRFVSEKIILLNELTSAIATA